MFFLIFPEGRLPSARWQRPVRLAALLTVGLGICFAVRPVEYSFDNIQFYPNRWGIDHLAPYDVAVVGFLQVTLGAFGVAALVRAARSFGHAGALRRAQVKWVLVPALLGPFVFAAGILLEGFTSTKVANLVLMTDLVGAGNRVASGSGSLCSATTSSRSIASSPAPSPMRWLGLLSLPITAGVAGMAMFVPSSDPVVLAISTLTAFALFNPVRRRVQMWFERQFNRSRYDATRVMDRFSRDLGERADPDLVVEDWLDVVAATMEPAASGVCCASSGGAREP